MYGPKNSLHHPATGVEAAIMCESFSPLADYFAVCGDIQLNPGPSSCKCSVCRGPVRDDQDAIFCEVCLIWNHRSCVNMSVKKLDELHSYCLCESPDIIMITESWLSPVVYDHEVCIQGFGVLRLEGQRQTWWWGCCLCQKFYPL